MTSISLLTLYHSKHGRKLAKASKSLTNVKKSDDKFLSASIYGKNKLYIRLLKVRYQ